MVNQPIIILGHPRSGSTLLSAILSNHSQIVTSSDKAKEYVDIQQFLDKLLDKEFHHTYTAEIEQPKIWACALTNLYIIDEWAAYKKELNILTVLGFREWVKLQTGDTKRYLGKIPQSTYYLGEILKLLPDAKIVFTTREKPDVIASFGQKSRWAFDKVGYEVGIKNLSRLYDNVETFIGIKSNQYNIPIIKYADLINDTVKTLTKLFEYLELPIEEYINDIKLSSKKDKWKERIPEKYHDLILGRI